VAVISPPPIDFDHPTDYRDEISAKPDRVRVVVIPERRYLMIDGSGTPGEQGFQDAMASLYPVAYTLHFALRKRAIEAPVGALEGLYWIGQPGPITPEQFAAPGSARAWSWRLLLPVPQAAGAEDVAAAIDHVRVTKHPPTIDLLRCERWQEGLGAQIMHVGPYDAETPTIEALHAAIVARGLRAHGCHHEIYISDPNRTAPVRLRTLIRQPVEWA
jgi:hypothetical protein